jgi:transcriptional regulator with XRE-family HTH domain
VSALAILLRRIGWSRRELARRLECSEAMVRNWEANEAPAQVMAWLRYTADQLPPPPNWRAGSRHTIRQMEDAK